MMSKKDIVKAAKVSAVIVCIWSFAVIVINTFCLFDNILKEFFPVIMLVIFSALNFILSRVNFFIKKPILKYSVMALLAIVIIILIFIF